MSDRTSRHLVIVDVQNDFCEGGALPVVGGNEVAKNIFEYVNAIQYNGWRYYNTVTTTQDWHIDPGEHWSDDPDFVDSWPVHCKAGTPGAQLHPAIEGLGQWIDGRFYKGHYSAAYSGMESPVPMIFNAQSRIDVVGLALDYCVYATAKDISEIRGYRQQPAYSVNIIVGLTAAINPQRVLQQQREQETAFNRINYI